MQPGYTFLNVLLLWVNTWSTFKTLNRRSIAVKGQRSSRFVQKNKREMKTCLSVWVVWVSWKMLERIIDTTIGLVIPFLHEMKCLFVFLLIITRPWGTEPLVLNVLRPAIKPYTGIIDASLHWLELGGDFLFLIICLPFHALMSWWWDAPEAQSEAQKAFDVADSSILAINIQDDPLERIPTPPGKPKAAPVIQAVTEAARAAIEEHRKEQERQEEEEAKLRELQEQVARDKAVHLYRVQKPPLPLPSRSNPNARASQILPRQQGASKSTSDLPASALNLPIKYPATASANSSRPTLSRPAIIPPPRPVVPNPNGESSPSSDEQTRPSIYPTSALAMPMPVRAARTPVRPAIHVNASVAIQRPSNPLPPITIPLATQTVGRVPRARPSRSTPPPGLETRSLGIRSTDTFVTTSSTSTVPVDEFGISSRNHKREPADDETVSGASQQTLKSGSGTTTTNEGGAGKQTWEDFMASLERQNQAATLPRGTSGPNLDGNSHPNNGKRGTVDIIATRGNKETMKRIAGLKKEVDEKLKRINDASGPQKGRMTTARQDTAGVVGQKVKMLEEMQVDVPHGQKRPRKAVDHAPALISSDESSSETAGKPELKRKKQELVKEVVVDNDATIASSNTKSSRAPARPIRTVTIKAKEKPVVASTVTRVKTARSVAKPPTEVIIPGTAMRTRVRRGGAS